MDKTKSPLASTGIWGGIIAGLASIGSLFGVVINELEQTELAAAVGDAAEGVATGDWSRLVTSAVAVFGAGLAIYGRWKATTRLSK